MERELILSLRNSRYDKCKVECEIETMKKLLPYIESFKTFLLNNDVFDIRRHKLIKKSRQLRIAFEEGLEKTVKYFVFSRN